ncbi:MAG: DUF2508 family protein [Bacillota bacterium]
MRVEELIRRFTGAKNKAPDKTEEYVAAVNQAWRQLQVAREYFNNVSDPELVDHAIYRMQAAQLHYIYLLKKAKEHQIRIPFPM